jgi:hypothetical protein
VSREGEVTRPDTKSFQLPLAGRLKASPRILRNVLRPLHTVRFLPLCARPTHTIQTHETHEPVCGTHNVSCLCAACTATRKACHLCTRTHRGNRPRASSRRVGRDKSRLLVSRPSCTEHGTCVTNSSRSQTTHTHTHATEIRDYTRHVATARNVSIFKAQSAAQPRNTDLMKGR